MSLRLTWNSLCRIWGRVTAGLCHLQGHLWGLHMAEFKPGTQLQLSTDWITHIPQATKFPHERKNLAWGYLEFAFLISVSFLVSETLQRWSSRDGWTWQCPLLSFLVSLNFHLKHLLRIFFVISERTGWLQKGFDGMKICRGEIRSHWGCLGHVSHCTLGFWWDS